VRLPRSSGLLLHPTSLPGPWGVGSLGREALEFADLLHAARQRMWQVLPLGPTGFGDSPYQCLSAFAGNPLLVSLESLRAGGYLEQRDFADAPPFSDDYVDYGPVYALKLPLLRRAYERFASGAGAAEREDFADFCTRQASWLEDFSLFISLKEAHGGVAWNRWPTGFAQRRPDTLARWRDTMRAEIEASSFAQWQFFKQWQAVRGHCHALGIRLIGDIPIFAAHDSADVWAHPELFDLNTDGSPRRMAGVPPDYFSATGQLWGNPLYRWDVHETTGYRWWVERVRSSLALVDIVRIDHFRGFEAYWEIPGDAQTAQSGRWIPGPGARLFERLRAELGELPVIAENLGVITPAVEALRTRFGFPGMAILQFAFGTDPQAPDFQPHNYTRDRAVYTGTHDNDTVVGWWSTTGVGESTRSAADVKRERDFTCRYLGTDGRDIHWTFIRTVLASVADVAIAPVQDLLGLGSEARMNTPSRPTGNWRWRLEPGRIDAAAIERLRELTVIYERAADEALPA
jgi:4-alpha-glucanotransferase